MKLFKVSLLFLFIILQYRLWFGDNAYPEYLTMSHKVEKLKQENEKINQRNKLMMADIEDLKSGLEAIEERARNELGLIKENEKFYRIAPSTAIFSDSNNDSPAEIPDNVTELPVSDSTDL